jgi:S-adenosylmethionine:tRNA ribosyltransferase-isomerase
MKTSDFDYELPDELIARYPLKRRTASRLMVVDGESGKIVHSHFSNLTDLLVPGDLLVFNNTRVIPARMLGRRESGGRVEILLERMTGKDTGLAHMKASNPLRNGTRIIVSEVRSLVVEGRAGALYQVRSEGGDLLSLMNQFGHMPLPPYMRRQDEASDRERYQTVYAKKPGAVAAPTAGLHFDHELLERIRAMDVHIAEVTLHVGAGTFQPVRVDDIAQHKMHSEWLEVPESVCEQVRETRKQGGRVVAVGTTTVRALETAARDGQLQPWSGETDIFIYPGFRFQVVDRLITNFHLPQSTLLMLVSAFSGRETILAAYAEAVRERYRFFSYGDAMWLGPCKGARS